MAGHNVTCSNCRKRTSFDLDEEFEGFDMKWECAHCNTVNVKVGSGAWGAPDDVETRVTVDGTTNTDTVTTPDEE